MSEKIYQEINLYQPIFRRRRQIFSAVTMLQSVAVVAVALMTVYAYGLWQVAALETQGVELESREEAYAAQLARLDPSAGIRRREQIERELETLNARLIAQQRLIDVLRERPLGSATGFSELLAALGRRHSPRLWLTEIHINGGTNSIELIGKSTDPGEIPAYLLRLGGEPALAGQRFDRFEIERSDSGAEVLFSVSSRAVRQ